MIIYDKNYKLIGISRAVLSFLGYNDLDEFKSIHDDFAELFVEKKGYIYNFKNFSWISYVLYGGGSHKKALISLKNSQEIETEFKVRELILLESINGSDKYYLIELINEFFDERNICIDPSYLTPVQIRQPKQEIKKDTVENKTVEDKTETNSTNTTLNSAIGAIAATGATAAIANSLQDGDNTQNKLKITNDFEEEKDPEHTISDDDIKQLKDIEESIKKDINLDNTIESFNESEDKKELSFGMEPEFSNISNISDVGLELEDETNIDFEPEIDEVFDNLEIDTDNLEEELSSKLSKENIEKKDEIDESIEDNFELDAAKESEDKEEDFKFDDSDFDFDFEDKDSSKEEDKIDEKEKETPLVSKDDESIKEEEIQKDDIEEDDDEEFKFDDIDFEFTQSDYKSDMESAKKDELKESKDEEIDEDKFKFDDMDFDFDKDEDDDKELNKDIKEEKESNKDFKFDFEHADENAFKLDSEFSLDDDKEKKIEEVETKEESSSFDISIDDKAKDKDDGFDFSLEDDDMFSFKEEKESKDEVNLDSISKKEIEDEEDFNFDLTDSDFSLKDDETLTKEDKVKLDEDFSFDIDLNENDEDFSINLDEDKPESTLADTITPTPKAIEYNIQDVSKNLGLDEILVKELVNDFISQVKSYKNDFDLAISEENYQSISKLFVKLKGVSVYLMIDNISTIIVVAQQNIQSKNIQKVKEAIAEINSYINELQQIVS